MTNLKSLVNDERMATAVANLDLVTSDLQNSVMKTRMLPVKKVFGRFPRVVRDLARTLKKEIDLEMEGEETDLDKNLVEALADPMVHLVRNAVDHGIESPEEREAAGKPRKGLVVLSASQEGDHILLTIADDGKGMDAAVLRELAVERGMMDKEAADRLSDRDCYNLIFQPGFSTKKEISDVSGRGVGMDVVKTGIAKINGIVEIDSELGKGSLITIKLPLTLAILPTLMVLLGGQPFALPLSSVVEIFDLDLSNSNVVDGQLTIMLREHALPIFYLRKWLAPDRGESDSESTGHVVVVNVGGIQAGLVVDDLVGQEEVVIKPLGAMLQGVDGMAGATITGDGKIALILDISGLLQKYARRI
jgi:two-component system chemotaxis sensor kinase CheA